MTDPILFLKECRDILFNSLKRNILDLELNVSLYQLKITFTTGFVLYIRYNEYNEYGYQLVFTKKKDNFVRWDNFDDRWDVSTRPNHFHSRYNKDVHKSQMIGQPSKDMQILSPSFEVLKLNVINIMFWVNGIFKFRIE